jgi:hypothetical protein
VRARGKRAVDVHSDSASEIEKRTLPRPERCPFCRKRPVHGALLPAYRALRSNSDPKETPWRYFWRCEAHTQSLAYELWQKAASFGGREVVQAFVAYRAAEGCSCCRNTDKHEAATERLGRALGCPRYDDNSGWDFDRLAKELA